MRLREVEVKWVGGERTVFVDAESPQMTIDYVVERAVKDAGKELVSIHAVREMRTDIDNQWTLQDIRDELVSAS